MNNKTIDKVERRQKKIEEPLKSYGDLLELKRSVSKTRLNRISAANRLLDSERFLQGINIYYSCFSAVLAIFSLISQERALGVWSAIITVILAISIVYLNAQKYGSRSQELKNNYIALHKLIFDIEAAISANDSKRNKEFTDRYCDLLQTSENHIQYDHLYQSFKSKEPMRWFEYVHLFVVFLLRLLTKIALVAFPVGLSLYLYVIDGFKGLI